MKKGGAFSVVALLLLTMCVPVNAVEGQTVVVEYTFSDPVVTFDGMFHSVSVAGLMTNSVPADPELPYGMAQVLLPMGHTVEGFTYETGAEHDLGCGYVLKQCPHPETPTEPGEPEQDQFLGDFPTEAAELISVQVAKGYSIAIFKLYPVVYSYGDGGLAYYNSITLTVQTHPSPTPVETFRANDVDARYVSGQVDNPAMMASYAPAVLSLATLPVAYHDYVIITDSALLSDFQVLGAWKASKGLSPHIETVGAIDITYSSLSTRAERIRAFIKDCYNQWGTQYVLLGGDVSIIPSVGLYGSVQGKTTTYTDVDIPGDIYYGALDGTWDADGDKIYGEPITLSSADEADYFYEVAIGRAPVETAAEAQAFVAKTIAFESGSYPQTCALLGGKLDNWTWGGDHMDELPSYLPVSFLCTKAYERDSTASTPAYTSALDGGALVVSEFSHGSPDEMGGFFKRSDCASLSSSVHGLLFTQGCYVASFDNRWWDGGFGTGGNGLADEYDTSDSLAEQLVYNASGPFACIGNSRYGWYVPGATSGASQQFNKEFYDAVFNEKITSVGRALVDAKLDNVASAATVDTFRWSYFGLNLLGDPETPLMAPATLDVTISALQASVAKGGTFPLQVTLTNTGFSDVAIGAEHTLPFPPAVLVPLIYVRPLVVPGLSSVQYVMYFSVLSSGRACLVVHVDGLDIGTGRPVVSPLSNKACATVGSFSPFPALLVMKNTLLSQANEQYSSLLTYSGCFDEAAWGMLDAIDARMDNVALYPLGTFPVSELRAAIGMMETLESSLSNVCT